MLMTYASCLLYPRKINESLQTVNKSRRKKSNTQTHTMYRERKTNGTSTRYTSAAPLIVLLIIISFNQIEMTF